MSDMISSSNNVLVDIKILIPDIGSVLSILNTQILVKTPKDGMDNEILGHYLSKKLNNGRESGTNRALDGNTYPS